MKKYIYYFCFLFLIFTGFLKAQETPTIKIRTSITKQIPADAIYFSITLTAENIEPRKAYDDHKVLEKNLLDIVKKFEVPDSNIQYSLLKISRKVMNNKDILIYQTNQTVMVKIDDFLKYDEVQLELLSNGIYNFNAKFLSDKKNAWIEQGVQEALIKAGLEAKMTANKLNKKIGKILEVEPSYSFPSASDMIMALSSGLPNGSLIDLPRYVQLSVIVSITYELEE